MSIRHILRIRLSSLRIRHILWRHLRRCIRHVLRLRRIIRILSVISLLWIRLRILLSVVCALSRLLCLRRIDKSSLRIRSISAVLRICALIWLRVLRCVLLRVSFCLCLRLWVWHFCLIRCCLRFFAFGGAYSLTCFNRCFLCHGSI